MKIADMNSTDIKAVKPWIDELKRVSNITGKDNPNTLDYNSNYLGSGLSLAMLRQIHNLTFNQLKTLAGMSVNNRGAPTIESRASGAPAKPKKAKRPCNKCGKMFTPGKTSFICVPCDRDNKYYHSEGSTNHDNIYDIW